LRVIFKAVFLIFLNFKSFKSEVLL